MNPPDEGSQIEKTRNYVLGNGPIGKDPNSGGEGAKEPHEVQPEGPGSYSEKSRWQIAALWSPAAIGVAVATALVLFESKDADPGRVAELCASLLIAGLAGVGVVAAFGFVTDKSDELQQDHDEEVEEQDKLSKARADRRDSENKRRKQAGAGVTASLFLICAAIVAGGLGTSGWFTNFLCFAGLVTAVVQIFGVPLSLVAARSTGQPFILDGVKDQ